MLYHILRLATANSSSSSQIYVVLYDIYLGILQYSVFVSSSQSNFLSSGCLVPGQLNNNRERIALNNSMPWWLRQIVLLPLNYSLQQTSCLGYSKSTPSPTPLWADLR